MKSLAGWKSGLATAVVAASLVVAAQAQAPQGNGGPPAAGAPARGGPPAPGPVDPRVQERTYTFKDTGEELPYAVFVSSKVKKGKKAPLIVALHPLGGNQNTMMRPNALELAEAGGYIMVAPMGYNSSGWYGAPSGMAGGTGGPDGGVGMGGPRRGGGGPGGPPPGAATGTTTGAAPGAGPGAGPPRGAMPPGAGPGAGPGGPGRGAAPTTLGVSNEVSQRSEKDVMNVLAMIRKEYKIDKNRIYLLGHSMGGAGAIYLGVKHHDIWAAVGAEAPATQPAGINPNNYSLAPAKDVPMIVIQGDMDTLVSHLTSTRPWIEQMKELGMTHQYIEVPGGDHGSVLTTGAPDVFAFFAKYTKKSR